jgi:hypothetical protein
VVTDNSDQSVPPGPDESGREETVEDLEAPADAQDQVAGGRDDVKCECAGTTVV